MNITILDIVIIAGALAIVIAAILSRFGERIRRQTGEINEMRKAVLKKHIEEIQARAQRNLVPLMSSRDLHRSDPGEIFRQAR